MLSNLVDENNLKPSICWLTVIAGLAHDIIIVPTIIQLGILYKLSVRTSHSIKDYIL